MAAPRERNASGREHVPGFNLSAEEVRALRECRMESFYYRCVPFSGAAMLATHYAVKAGYLRGHPRYGSLIKVIGASLFGYFVGTISYRSKCEEKLMQLQNSHLGELLRRRKMGLAPSYGDHFSGESGEYSLERSQPLVTDSSVYSDINVGGTGTWEIDEDKNVQYRGLDDSQRPTVDNPTIELEDQPTRSFTTYENLRRQNRDEFEASRSNVHHRKDSQHKQPPKVETWRQTKSPTNQYGDALE